MYKNYLHGEVWSGKRKAVWERCGGTCERCRLHPMDDVHHLTYENLFFEPLEDLWGLCRGCHKFVHELDPHDLDVSGYWAGLEQKKGKKLTPREVNDAMRKRK